MQRPQVDSLPKMRIDCWQPRNEKTICPIVKCVKKRIKPGKNLRLSAATRSSLTASNPVSEVIDYRLKTNCQQQTFTIFSPDPNVAKNLAQLREKSFLTADNAVVIFFFPSLRMLTATQQSDGSNYDVARPGACLILERAVQKFPRSTIFSCGVVRGFRRDLVLMKKS